ncbi:MAG: delta 1-pyrroline-5-carboxylate reductase [Caeruleum heppii]|nr:MAG: delta 1-pyrroline-5-carboxylate reductase [Caeruleum heppii]
MDSYDENLSPNRGLTVSILGCGNLGTAILSGIVAALIATDEVHSENLPPILPDSLMAAVNRPESVQRLTEMFGSLGRLVEIVQKQNLLATSAADVVILGCKPYMVREILTADEMIDTLSGKLLISICAGVSVEDIEEIMYGSGSPAADTPAANRCRVVRAMPNMAAQVRQSMTIISSPNPLPADDHALVTWIFERIGRVIHLPSSVMDASTALCGSGPAFCALILEAMADGAVAMGLPRADAQRMAAQTMKGTAELALAGEHPAVLKDKVCSPGGCTIGGLLVLEEGAVRGTVSRAVREAADVASLLGKGVKGVNGTRAGRN